MKRSIKRIALRAAVTAIQAALGMLLVSGFTDLSPDKLETALVSGLAASASVVYNAAGRWLEESDSSGLVKVSETNSSELVEVTETNSSELVSETEGGTDG